MYVIQNTFGELETGKDFQDIKYNLVDLQVFKKKKKKRLSTGFSRMIHYA